MIPRELSADRWLTITPIITNGTDNRNKASLQAVISQFQVSKNPRHLKFVQDGKEGTSCNIFVSDFTKAMGCEIPRTNGAKELLINDMVIWLENVGTLRHQWKRTNDYEYARASAFGGLPVVPMWRNPTPGRSGHGAVVVPDAQELVIAQAGSENFERCRLAVGFGDKIPTFWIHP